MLRLKITAIALWFCCTVACGQGVPPLKSLYVTSGFGYRLHPVTGELGFHAGIDLRASRDTVYAVLPGKVDRIGYHPFLGVYICLDHGEIKSSYGHLSQILVLPGDTVVAGKAIGITGATGRVTGKHLHFSIRLNGNAIDPVLFINTLLRKINR
jgi:murein DD-endopeptidase MepM/ murein hydrolase activator NlpD